MPNNKPIGVFDSGLGGLTAVKELRKLLPNENIVYFGDTGRLPYGNRSVDTIIEYAKEDADFLLSQNAKFLIAACGTVSSTFPAEYTSTLPAPYLGVIKSTAMAAVKATKTKRIGVIGTVATIKSQSYETEVKKLLPDAEITATACPLFVPFVENGMFHVTNHVTNQVANDYLKDIKAANVDVLIMGCTHYPLLEPILKNILGDNVTLIDPGRETAKMAKEILTANNMLNESAQKGSIEYYVSDGIETFAETASVFLGESVLEKVHKVKVGK